MGVLMNRKNKPMRRPKTLEEFHAMSIKDQDKWIRATRAISGMRQQEVSLQQASRDVNLTPQFVRSMAGQALKKQKNGRFVARRTDRLLRVLLVPQENGLHDIGLADSRQATLVGKYSNAVDDYLDTGNSSLLRKIRKTVLIDASGKRIRLIKDLHVLDRLASAGVLNFESIYARTV